MELDILDLKTAIKDKNVDLIRRIMNFFDLEARSGYLVAKDVEKAKTLTAFWNQRQQARKILLNESFA